MYQKSIQKYLFCFITVVAIGLIPWAQHAISQNIIYKQGFEGSVCENLPFTGGEVSANSYKSGQYSGRIGYPNSSMTISASNLGGYHNTVLTIYHAARPGQGPGMDTREGVVIQVSINGGPFTTIAAAAGYGDSNWPFSSSTGGATQTSSGCNVYKMPNPVVFNIPAGTNSIQARIISVKAGTCNAFNAAMANATPNEYDRTDEGFYIDEITITTSDPLPTLTLVSNPSTEKQLLVGCGAVSISDIVYRSATGNITVSGLPTGVTYSKNGPITTISGAVSQDGIYHYTITDICDGSSSTGSIEKKSPTAIIDQRSIEACKSVRVNGIDYSTSITLRDTIRSVGGCDSVINITNITIIPITVDNRVKNFTGCKSVRFNGIDYSSSTTIRDTIRSIGSCDSVINITNITITPITVDNRIKNLTSCKSVRFNGIDYSSSTSIRDTIRSVGGCDSIINITNIIITPITVDNRIENFTNCKSVRFNGIDYSNSIALRDTTRSIGGCDSVINITNISITPITVDNRTKNLTGCKSVRFNGIDYSNSIALRDTTRSIGGCDSVINITNITITPITVDNRIKNLTSCKSVRFNGIDYSSSTTIRDTIRSVGGCDSVINITNITITPITVDNRITNLTGCKSVQFNGIDYSNSTTLRDTIKSAGGCDSVINISNITITPIAVDNRITNFAGCKSVRFNGIDYSSSTTIRDTTRSIGGCDSVINITNITITPIAVDNRTKNLTGCKSVRFNGIDYSSSTIIRDTIRSIGGCDSVINITNISITPITADNRITNLTGCKSVRFNGIDYSNSITLRDTIKSVGGCDSVINIINISITPISVDNRIKNLTSCKSVRFNGIDYSSSITLKDTTRSIGGCDSVINITNIAITPIAVDNRIKNLTGCKSVRFNGIDYSSSITLKDTTRSIRGCDSVINITNINIIPITADTRMTNLTGCKSVRFNGIDYSSSITLKDTTRSIRGCDSVINITNINIAASNFSIQISASSNDVPARTPVNLSVASNTNFVVQSWWPAALFSRQHAYQQSIQPDTSMIITVIGKTSDSCVAQASIRLQVSPIANEVYFPSAFNSHSTVGNNSFGALGALQFIQQYSLQIFNRWGEMIFSSSNPYQRWNGTQKGQPVGTGVFIWRAVYMFRGTQHREQSGTVTVIR